MGDTIIVIKSTFDKIFGGYTNISFKNLAGDQKDTGKTFLFYQ